MDTSWGNYLHEPQGRLDMYPSTMTSRSYTTFHTYHWCLLICYWGCPIPRWWIWSSTCLFWFTKTLSCRNELSNSWTGTPGSDTLYLHMETLPWWLTLHGQDRPSVIMIPGYPITTLQVTDTMGRDSPTVWLYYQISTWLLQSSCRCPLLPSKSWTPVYIQCYHPQGTSQPRPPSKPQDYEDAAQMLWTGGWTFIPVGHLGNWPSMTVCSMW